MSGKSLVDQIKHYQKDIERCPENSDRMIRCIQRLYVLPIQVLHLQETGVGRSVNSLRKYKGEVGEAAKALVAKWKAMVAAEESSDDSNEKLKIKSTENKLNKSTISTVKVEPKSEKPVVKVEPKSEKLIVKTEPKPDKLDHSSSRDKYSSKDRSISKDKSSSKDKYNNKEKTSVKSHHSESHSSKYNSSSLKRSHSTSEKNHSSEKRSSSHKNHKSSHHEKKHESEEEGSPSTKKHKKHHSHSRNHSYSKKEIVESEEEADEEDEDEEVDSERSEIDDSSSNSEKESTEESESSSVEEEEPVTRIDDQEEDAEEEEELDSDNSSSDHRHRSKHKSSSHHKHKKSSHSHSEKNKENHNSHKSSSTSANNSSRHLNKKSSKDSKSSSKHMDELIKENEKKIKKEKEEFEVPKYIPTKIVKLERNEDGSIDSGSGASFADALLGMDSFVDSKKKKKVSPKETSSSSNHKTSSHKSSSSSSKRSHSHSSSSHGSKEKSKESSSSRPKTIDELVETPELLTRKVKLEALDLDISSTLPEINPNYKPLPHIPESSRRSMKTMSEEDTMFSIMTTKNQRTKVYSGNKVYQNTVPSLFNLCIQLLYENIDAVEYTGGVPYNLLKPLLERLNSDQLYVIEHFNPYLIEDTDNLWKFHCSKDFRSEKRQDMESWRDLYLRCLEERERKLKALTANISQSMAKSTPVRQAKLAYVDSVVKPPRNIARKQAKYGTGGSTPSSKSSSSNNKQDIVNKAIVGGHTPGVSAKDVVPPPPAPRAVHHATPAIMKKKKAPLMQKALQFIKGNRYKR